MDEATFALSAARSRSWHRVCHGGGGLRADAVRVRGLRKSYGDVAAVAGLDLTIARGNTFSWADVLVVAAWGIGAMLLAVRYFSWEPRT